MKTRTVLYIEDDPTSQRLIERTLQSAGYRVVVASRGLQGIDLARTLLPDLILIDINLPDLSGHEIATVLRSDRRFVSMPMVAITAQGSQARQDIAIAAGINGYLTKPIDVDALPGQIEFYLSGGQDEIDADKLTTARIHYTQGVVARLEKRIRQLESANESLQKFDRLKEAFIQITAHELRTPLTLIYGYLRLLEAHPPLQMLAQRDEVTTSLVNGLNEATSRMHTVVDEILTVSRIMTSEVDLSIAPINLGQVAQGVLDSYRVAFNERQLTVHFNINEWPRIIQGDAELLRLALSNLVGNAIKYTPDGGDIYLTTQPATNSVVFCVRDTGIGIDPADQASIFDAFSTAEDTLFHSSSKTAFGGGGLGLVLSLCRSIIEAHGGTITVSSSERNKETRPGTTFTVRLPLVTSAMKARTL